MIPSTFRLVNGVFQRAARAVAAVRVEKFGERAIDQLQRNMLEALRPLLACPIVGGNLFTDVPFTNGVPKQLPHMLERSYAGFIVTRSFVPVAIVEASQEDGLAGRFITLQSDVDATVDVYVF